MPRKFFPYEITHLSRFGKGRVKPEDIGETPVEYITGKVEFDGRVFNIDTNTLIPRIESEELVTLASEQIKQLITDGQVTIADVGCGCGAIGISLALRLEKERVSYELFLSDISTEALKIAQKNLDLFLPKTKKVKILVSDILSSYPSNKTFDLIIANLPYIPSERIAYLDESVKDHEPHLALDGGPEGLKYIRQLIRQAEGKTRQKTEILLEIDYTHKLADFEEFTDNWETSIKIDSFERSRFAHLQKR